MVAGGSLGWVEIESLDVRVITNQSLEQYLKQNNLTPSLGGFSFMQSNLVMRLNNLSRQSLNLDVLFKHLTRLI